MMPSTEILVLGALLAGAAAYVLRLGRREEGLPPGPPTIPFLGNIHMLGDAKDQFLKMEEWARHYGDIYSIKLGSGTMVVLSSATAIKQVVDKKGWAGSSRPGNYIAELLGSGHEYNIHFVDDCPRLKNLRRNIERFFTPQNLSKYAPAQGAESTLLLHDLMTQPADYSQSIRRYTHSVAKIMAYGKRAPSFHDDEVQRFYTSLDGLVRALAPGEYPPFDLLPVLKYLPAPFAPWRSACSKVASVRGALRTQMYEALMRRQAAGDEESTECFIGKLFQTGVPKGEETFYAYTGLAILDAGSDAVASFVLSFVLVLATYPEYQARACKEIDGVVGRGRLPELADFSKLPYLDALMKEITRFKPQFPMGMPHMMAGDAVYKDYVVPKGTVVMLNTYALFHDPEIFENPEIFNPDRFLNSEHGTRPGMDTDFRDNFLFGGGRRICPGQPAARSTMQITAMRLVWALKFGTPTDPMMGEPISRDLDFYSYEFVAMPRPFKCAIEPRSAEHRDIVVHALEDAKNYLSRYESK